MILGFKLIFMLGEFVQARFVCLHHLSLPASLYLQVFLCALKEIFWQVK